MAKVLAYHQRGPLLGCFYSALTALPALLNIMTIRNFHSFFICILAFTWLALPAISSADILLSEDFSGGNGGFTATSTGNSTLPWTFNADSSTWSTDGEQNGTPTMHFLASPEVTIPTAGVVRVTIQHGYSFEADWDGGVAQVSINGESFKTVDGDFAQNGYTNDEPLLGEHDLTGEDAFTGNSPGVAGGTLITSIFDIEDFAATDTIVVRFLAAFDQGARGTVIPNWRIDRVIIETLTDNDNDGMSNSFEEQYAFLNPEDPADAELDEDSDSLTNLEEFQLGTLPDNSDTDGDGYSDGAETGTGIWLSASNTGTDPLVEDSDQDGLPDGIENPDLPYSAGNAQNQPGSDPNKANTDGDFADDAMEVANGSDPTDPKDTPEILLFRYEFDTATDAPLVDSSGQNQIDLATPSNGPEHRFGTPSLVGGTGFSIGLDAPGEGHTTGSYLRVFDAIHPQTFSFSIWIKSDNGGARNPIFSRENVWSPSPGAFYKLEVDGSGALQWVTGQSEAILTEPDVIVDGEIYHIVVTYLDTDGPDTFEADRTRLYVNGVMLGELEAPEEVPSLEAIMDANNIYQTIWVGTASAGPGFKGELDDFQHYSTELTPEQVLAMYENPGTTAPFGVGTPFEITNVSIDELTRDVSLTWTSKAKKSYTVEASVISGGFEWEEIEDGVSSEEESETTTYVDQNVSPDTTYKIYRVKQE
ncbi:MAG: hypothetical protein ACI9R3_005692 [Verrucomicrobiales bacterium]|jgi:hypothetical protein